MATASNNIASLPLRVLKRDGAEVAFDAARIESAILRAGQASGEYGDMESRLLTAQVVKVLAHRFGKGRVPDIESIQDVVEQTLIAANHFETARSYIVYREQHTRLRDHTRTLVDVAASIDEYLDRSDWRVAANANQGYSLGGLILNTSGKMIANYWLSHVYPPEIGEVHRDGSIHVHDLDMLCGYCAGWSLRTLLHEGLNGVPGRVEAGPPRHMSSAVGQIVNFLGTLQNEWAGAQAFSSFDTYMAPFVRTDRLDYAQVRQCIQELIYNLNVPSRWGTQTPFTNLTFDWVCPEDLREQIPVIAGEEQPYTYGDLQAEMDLINRAYIEVMTEGDAKGRIFTFPIPTYNITADFPWESENADRLFAMTAKYGLPYFQNFINSELSPNMVRSMCCRLQLDLRELLKRGNGLFGSAEQTGSVGVVTINCARLGYQ
jgi:anaerobic ribonucleoside-triphosphate reductase